MNFQIICVLIFVSVTQIDALIYEDGNLVQSRQTNVCPSVKCSGCTAYEICYDETMPPVKINCPSTAPYCLNGRCGNVKGDCSNFFCTSTGTFPDPTDCTKYHQCIKGEYSKEEVCQAGYIYNSKLKVCARGVPRVDHGSRRICQKISCEKKPTGFILFPANPAYYLYCENTGGVQQMTMFKCDDDDNKIYDIVKQKCIFNCKSPGYFADPLDCTAYYHCNGWIKYDAVRYKCPDDRYFKEDRCITSSAHCPFGSIFTQDRNQPPIEPNITPDPNQPTIEPNVTPDPNQPPTEPNVTMDPEAPSIKPKITMKLTAVEGANIASNPLNDHTIRAKPSKYSVLPFQSHWKHVGKYSIRL